MQHEGVESGKQIAESREPRAERKICAPGARHSSLSTLDSSLRSRRGFTLIELLVTMSIIALLLALAAPRYFSHVDSAKETVLRENLHEMRDAIDKFYGDNARYPDSLQDLVTRKYLRRVPPDPITDSEKTWVVVPPKEGQKGGVYDVKSGAKGNGKDATPYNSW